MAQEEFYPNYDPTTSGKSFRITEALDGTSYQQIQLVDSDDDSPVRINPATEDTLDILSTKIDALQTTLDSLDTKKENGLLPDLLTTNQIDIDDGVDTQILSLNINRKLAIITNIGTSDVYIGLQGSTPGLAPSGDMTPLIIGDSLSLEYTGTLYAQTTSGNSSRVAILETSNS